MGVTSAPNSTHPQLRLYSDIFDQTHLFLDRRLGRRSICYKSTPVSTTLRILIDLNNAVVWMVSTRPFIFKFSSPSTNLLLTTPSVTITIGVTFTFMFHSFSAPLQGPVNYLSFNFTSWSAGTVKFTIRHVLFFRWLSLSLVVWPRSGDQFLSQHSRELCVSFFRIDSGLCI